LNHLPKLLTLLESTGISATLIFIPLLANTFTRSYIQVGAIVAGYSLAQTLSYIYFGRLSDRLGDRVSLIRVGYLFCTISFLAHIFTYDGLSLFTVRVAAGLSTGVYTGPLLAYSYELDRHRSMLAGVVAFGALGWFFGTFSAGLVEQYYPTRFTAVFLLSSTMFLLGFIASLRLPSLEVERLEGRGVTLNLIKENWAVYSSFFLRYLGASATWSVFPIFLEEELAANRLWIGVIYAVNSLTQFVFMNLMGRGVRISNRVAVQLGALLSAAVFSMYASSQSFLYILPVQLILGLSWSLLYLGSLLYLLERNFEKATSTSMLRSTISLSSIPGPVAAGFIADLYGLRVVLIFAALVSTAAYLISRRA